MQFITKFTQTRLLSWIIYTVLVTALVAFIAPQQIAVTLYKVSLVMLGAVLAYWLSRALFPKLRLQNLQGWELIAAAGVRAILALACILGMTLGF